MKCSARDLPIAAARGATGATTVAATAQLAAAAGIALFATGGLGGVHREARETWDESADLVGLARTRICVVCAGVKSILDVPATLERLETLGHRRRRLPDRPVPRLLPDRLAATPCRGGSTRRSEVVGGAARPRAMLGLDDTALVDRQPAARGGAARSGPARRACSPRRSRPPRREGVRGRDVTPFLLARFHAETGGESLRANVALVLANARLAGRDRAAAAAARA